MNQSPSSKGAPGARSGPKVLSVVWNLIRGGTEGQCARTAMACVQRGGRHRVAVFRREGFFLEAVERNCGPAYVLGIERMFAPKTLREVIQFKNWIVASGVDVVHAWDADAAIFGALAARWASVPFITSRRDLGEIYSARKLRLMKWADRRSAAVVVNARSVQDWLVSCGTKPERVRRIANMMDIDEFDAVASRPFAGEERLGGRRCVAMVARLDPEKDAELLLRAMGRLQPSHADALFVVAGDGPERPRLERFARDRGLSHAVVFLGEVNEVPALLGRVCAGVLVPRANEGLSNTILEYMAASLPVVATDCGGNRELVEEGKTGFLVPVGDEVALAGRIAQLLDDPERAREMGAEGRRRVVHRHRPAHVVRQFAALYEEVAAERTGLFQLGLA